MPLRGAAVARASLLLVMALTRDRLGAVKPLEVCVPSSLATPCTSPPRNRDVPHYTLVP